MKKPEVHIGRKENGRLKAGTFKAAFDALPEGPVFLTVEGETHRRTNPQNAYLHWLFRDAANKLTEFTGQTYAESEVKNWLKMELLPKEIVTPDGEVIRSCRDTSELDDAECSRFIEGCVAALAQRGIICPLPGEQMELEA